MLRQALLKQRSVLTGWLASLGAVLGVLLLCLSIQFYTDILRVIDGNNEIMGSDFIPVHKKIGSGLMSAVSPPEFSESELEEMRKQPYTKGVGVIHQGLFKVSGSLSPAEGLPGMYTELFFESIDARYLDVEPQEWKWKQGSSEVPVILPSMYLEMYNFGMAPSQNLPVLNEKTIKQFRFNLNISGKGNGTRMSGKIAGFSSRINTILVPFEFLQWANEEYGYKSTGKTIHVIWEVKDVTDPRIEAFLREHNYVTNMELLMGNRAKTVLNLVLALFLLLGGVMVLLSLMVFMLYNQLLIARKDYNLRVLFSMGYSRRVIWFLYLRRYLLLVLVIAGASLTGLILGQQTVSGYFEDYYIEHGEGIYTNTWLTFGGAVLLLLVFNTVSLWRRLGRIAATPGQSNS